MRHANRLLPFWGGLWGGLLLATLIGLGLAPLGCSSSKDSGGAGSGGSSATGSGGSHAGSGGSSSSGGASGSGGTTAGSGGISSGPGDGSGGKTGGSGGMVSNGSGGIGSGSGGTTAASGGVTGAGGKGGTSVASSGGAGGKPTSSGSGGAPAGSGGAAGGSGGGHGGAGGKVRIMPLGDSTTASICYRSDLWQMLTQAGHTFDFVGTRNGYPGCSFTGYDKDNEGHAGYIVTDLLKATSTGRPSGADTTDPFDSSAKDLATWFDGNPADLVLMHFGTNDVWNGKDPADILKAYSAILTRLRANNPSVHLLVAQITPLNPSGCGDKCTTGVPALNAMIPGWATQNSTTQSPVTVVDQYTNFNPDTDTKDGVHSNDMGSTKLATNWFNALGPLL